MAAIIRRERAGPTTVLALGDIEREAAFIVAGAETQARRLITEAEARARVIAQQHETDAGKRGFAAGRQQGFEQAQREARETARREARDRITALTDALTAAIHEYEAAKHGLLAAAESGLVALALAIARRVCKIEAARTVDVTTANVRALLQLVQHQGDLELHVNPAQCELLAELAPAVADELGKAGHVRVVPDPSVAPGGGRIVAGAGIIDARIETQLDRLAAALCQAESPLDPATGGPA
jgi:flagellar biosynthesis/type III secretory pathway protein FliH